MNWLVLRVCFVKIDIQKLQPTWLQGVAVGLGHSLWLGWVCSHLSA